MNPKIKIRFCVTIRIRASIIPNFGAKMMNWEKGTANKLIETEVKTKKTSFLKQNS